MVLRSWFKDHPGISSTVRRPCYAQDLKVNTLRPRQNGRRFANDTFKRIYLNENFTISIKISLKFVPKGPITKNPALVQIMAWRRSGDKPLSETMMVSSPTHICATRPQWVKNLWLTQCSRPQRPVIPSLAPVSRSTVLAVDPACLCV